MKKFTRLYAEGGDILNNFYPSGAVGSNAPTQTTLLQGAPSSIDGGKETKKAKRWNKKNLTKMKCYKRNC